MIEPRAAYIDPAVGSYIIMTVASIAVPIGGVIIMMWRDIKGKLIEVFHLEDKFITEIESDVVLIEPLDETDDVTLKATKTSKETATASVK